MAVESQSTVRSREIGDAVRLAMERAGFSGKRVGEMLGWSESRVSRILTGHISVSEVDLAAILALCGLVGDQREHLLSLCREQTLTTWSTNRHSLAIHQQRALRITGFHDSLIPPLLQVDSYSKALAARTVNLEYEEIGPWVSLRRQAQAVFERVNPKPPRCTFFVHEQALYLPVGGSDVMSDQLHHLLRMGIREYLAVRIIPSTVGAHPGTGGPFCLMEFAEFNPVCYVEGEIEGHFFEGTHQITAYQHVVAALSVVAMDRKDSADLLETVAAQIAANV